MIGTKPRRFASNNLLVPMNECLVDVRSILGRSYLVSLPDYFAVLTPLATLTHTVSTAILHFATTKRVMIVKGKM